MNEGDLAVMVVLSMLVSLASLIVAAVVLFRSNNKQGPPQSQSQIEQNHIQEPGKSVTPPPSPPIPLKPVRRGTRKA